MKLYNHPDWLLSFLKAYVACFFPSCVGSFHFTSWALLSAEVKKATMNKYILAFLYLIRT